MKKFIKKLTAIGTITAIVAASALCGGCNSKFGYYKLKSVSAGSAGSFEASANSDMSGYLKLEDDTNGYIHIDGAGADTKFTYDDKKVDLDGTKVPYTLKDKVFTINEDEYEMVFEYDPSYKPSESSNSSSSQSSEDSQSSYSLDLSSNNSGSSNESSDSYDQQFDHLVDFYNSDEMKSVVNSSDSTFNNDVYTLRVNVENNSLVYNLRMNKTYSGDEKGALKSSLTGTMSSMDSMMNNVAEEVNSIVKDDCTVTLRYLNGDGEILAEKVYSK